MLNNHAIHYNIIYMKCGSVVDELFRRGTCSVKSSGNDFSVRIRR